MTTIIISTVKRRRVVSIVGGAIEGKRKKNLLKGKVKRISPWQKQAKSGPVLWSFLSSLARQQANREGWAGPGRAWPRLYRREPPPSRWVGGYFSPTSEEEKRRGSGSGSGSSRRERGRCRRSG